jgi:hypothetical protein
MTVAGNHATLTRCPQVSQRADLAGPRPALAHREIQYPPQCGHGSLNGTVIGPAPPRLPTLVLPYFTPERGSPSAGCPQRPYRYRFGPNRSIEPARTGPSDAVLSGYVPYRCARSHSSCSITSPTPVRSGHAGPLLWSACQPWRTDRTPTPRRVAMTAATPRLGTRSCRAIRLTFDLFTTRRTQAGCPAAYDPPG